jgi:serine protease Do
VCRAGTRRAETTKVAVRLVVAVTPWIEDIMSSRRSLFAAVAMLTLLLGPIVAGSSQEPAASPTSAARSASKDLGGLTKTGARYTHVVAAIQRVRGAVVNIHSERTVPHAGTDTYPTPASPSRVNGMGTGIVIDPRGYLVTNHHVIDEVQVLRVKLSDGSQTHAVIVARSPEIDLAILKIDPPAPLAVMPIGTAHDLMVGETVLAIGNAYGYEHSVSLGIVSAVKRDVSLNKDMAYKNLIQTDAAINPGNSGGPLVNVNGELVGVNVAIRAGAQCIGFAIPADQMVRTVTDLLRNRRRGYSYDGLYCKDVLEATGDGLMRRVVVERIEPNSPAAAAGLKLGDMVVQAGNLKVATGIDVERAFLERKAGDIVPFVLNRQGEEKRVELVLGSADRSIQTVATSDVVWQKLGMQLAAVAPEQVTRFNSELRGGLEVTGINVNGPAARAGIKKGDILVGLQQYETITLDNVTFVLNLPEVSGTSQVPFYILRGGQVRRGQMER